MESSKKSALSDRLIDWENLQNVLLINLKMAMDMAVIESPNTDLSPIRKQLLSTISVGVIMSGEGMDDEKFKTAVNEANGDGAKSVLGSLKFLMETHLGESVLETFDLKGVDGYVLLYKLVSPNLIDYLSIPKDA